ncbi:DUF5819 family protein [Streptomyces daliensis]|uniref:Uncharacterized protein n=1 Tax=Streptomyces daliensis TaxID=299421 RepID=A0A8T4IZG3_9ACTN|nr:hypothetical protein [Streptomyces daliensis]
MESGASKGHGGPPSPAVALSRSSWVLVASAAVVLACAAALHLLMAFLHLAPPNTASRQYGQEIAAYVEPEFEQNWKLFAPDPLQANIHVHARLELLTPDGGTRRTGWTDLTAGDREAIRGNPAPSHTRQNELRRAWDFFHGSHDARNRSTGTRGALSEMYLKRIVLARLDDHHPLGTVHRVQIKAVTTPVAPPSWSAGTRGAVERDRRVLPWWPAAPGDVTADGSTEARH